LRADRLILGVALAGLAGGLALQAAGRAGVADLVWALGVLPVLAALLAEIVMALRAREVGLDVVAALSMTAALLAGETLAAAVVALMYAGGTFLEAYADRHARTEMSALLARVPRRAVLRQGERLVEVDLDAVAPGDRILVPAGEAVPVDGCLTSARAVLDLSALTGESLPATEEAGASLPSGAMNAGPAFEMEAQARAADSTFAGIVRLVEAAQRAKAPMSRMADRASWLFLAVTLAVAALAWAVSGDPRRVVAVLVVATPCPLILAVPVAMVAGLSRAARAGVLVKGGGALEAMARVRTLILDKTGTLTEGRPRIARIDAAPGLTETEVLRLAAALDQVSRHPVAQALVQEARARGLDLPPPEDAVEVPGAGLTGRVEGRALAVGGTSLVPGATSPAAGARRPGEIDVDLAIDGRHAGTIILSDPLRAEAPALLSALRRGGIGRLLLATGDRTEVAEAVTGGLVLDEIAGDMSPEDKVALVTREARSAPVMMVGDGVNDAPALAAATVGVAMGARGAAASAEAADVVLLVDRIDPLLAGLRISHGAVRIARQSVAVGIGLSFAGMLAAAAGWLSPVQGALLQEVIDVAAILNALRVLRLPA